MQLFLQTLPVNRIYITSVYKKGKCFVALCRGFIRLQWIQQNFIPLSCSQPITWGMYLYIRLVSLVLPLSYLIFLRPFFFALSSSVPVTSCLYRSSRFPVPPLTPFSSILLTPLHPFLFLPLCFVTAPSLSPTSSLPSSLPSPPTSLPDHTSFRPYYNN